MIRDGITIQSVEDARAAMPAIFDKIDADRGKRERRAEWLEAKRGKFGASSAGKLWTSTLQLADNATSRGYLAEKAAEIDGAMSSELGGASVKWGSEQEGPGMLEFIERSGLAVTHHGEDQEWIAASWSDQIGCTPDGIATNTEGQRIPIEQKNPHSRAIHARYMTMQDGADLLKYAHSYWCQVQHQIMVLDAPFGIYFTRDSRRTEQAARIGWWVVPRDDAFIDQHKARLLDAVQERDDLFNAQAGREWVDLSNFIKQ